MFRSSFRAPRRFGVHGPFWRPPPSRPGPALASVLTLLPSVLLTSACNLERVDPGQSAQRSGGRPGWQELEVPSADGTHTIHLPERPVRIVSQSEASDDILLGLVDAERIAAVSSRSRNDSVFPAKVERISSFVENSGEQILGLRPDLVITAAYSAPELVQVIERAGLPHLQLQNFAGWADIRRNILLIGRAVGAQSQATTWVDSLDGRLELARQAAAARTGPRPRALAYTYGNAQARGSTFDDALAHCGADNVAGRLEGWAAVDVEQIAAWDPDVVFLSGDASVESREGAASLRHPVLEQTRLSDPLRTVVIPGTLFGTVSQRYVELVELVCQALERLPSSEQRAVR